MSKITREVIIMGQSEIGDRMAETQHGVFDSIKDAEIHGEKKIKAVKWRVANRVTRTKDNGETEVDYEFLAPLVDPRRRDD